VVYAVVLGTVFLGYGIPFVGIALSAVAAAIVASERRDIWHVALPLPRAALLAVLIWIGLWLPAMSYVLTGGWEWYPRDISTAWLLLPIQGPANLVVGTLVPALAAVVVFAVGLKVSVIMQRPWLVVIGAWLAPWAHELVFYTVTEMG
jgi:hypothetical protein